MGDMEQNGAQDATDAGSKTKEEKPKMVSLAELFSFARTRKSRLCIAGAFMSACVSGAVYPDLGGLTESDNFMATVRKLAYTFMTLGAIVLVSMTAQAALMELAAAEMTMALKTDWFKALLRQDIAYYDIMDVSGEGTIISVNANKYRKGVGRKLAQAVQFFVTFCGGLGYAFYASWQVTLVVLAVTPFFVLSGIFVVKMSTSVSARANASYAKAGSIVSASVLNIRTILALNAVEIMIEQFKGATKQAYDGAVNQVAWLGLAEGSVMGSMLLSYVVVTLYGSYLIYHQVGDNGCDPSGAVPGNDRCDPAGADVFGALMGISFAAMVLPQVSSSVEALVGARVASYPAFAVIHRTTDMNSKTRNDNRVEELALRRGGTRLPEYVIDSSSDAGMKPETVLGEIEFINVSFRYPTREKEVLRDFSLKIEAGKTVALVGVSGCGKSTVTQLIERFYDVVGGSITLDGTDLRELNVKWLRSSIALVQQEPKLFECSVRANIAIGAPGATNEQIEMAARMANAHDFIMGFPKGYDTEVGALGDQLSGGQRQRISIARCLVKNPKILLLDEATSALDSEAEATVQQALDDLMKLTSMTTFVIAHRLSTIKNADLIAVVDDGMIVEMGTHEELLTKQTHYFRLVEAQRTKSSDTPVKTPLSSEHGSRRDWTIDSSVEGKENGVPAMIEFEDVYFEYPSRPDAPVFRGLNLKVRRGETLALVGPSGSGKSTAIQLIEGFYRPTSGTVKFKGVDAAELNVRWLRSQLGLVSQQPVLFDCSIDENIRYGRPNATNEQVIEAAKQANAHNFIVEFPEGYATSVGQGSSLVSGGQKQRICIARALVVKPQVLLLDEATSALDSESEKFVQDALDKLMFDKHQTCIVIAHRLSTIASSDRIAVVDNGKISEIGTHEELMVKPDGRYKRLQALQNLNAVGDGGSAKGTVVLKRAKDDDGHVKKSNTNGMAKVEHDDDLKVDKKVEAANAKKARMLASGDTYYLFVGGFGALLSGLMFPSWGFVFAYMIEVLYTPVEPCPPASDCQSDWSDIADDMQDESLKVFYAYVGVIFTTLLGFTLLFYGFGIATEKMNRRVRDAAFTSLLRQEVAWYDVRSPGAITSRLSDDAALLHAYTGEPIRTLVSNLASVLVGVIVSFVYMWPFALLTLAMLPFMGVAAQLEITMYFGEDDSSGDGEEADANSPGGIVVEALSNIRTVASLTLEDERAAAYAHALEKEDPHSFRNNVTKGGTAGLGQGVQMWGIALMFWWGGWLLFNYPGVYSFRDFLISMFSLLFALSGLAIAAEGAVDRNKAKLAAARVFELTDRQSLIDPLSTEGKKDI